MTSIPPYITVSQVARACGLPVRRVKRRLRSAGIAEQHGGPGTHWVVGESVLRERLPEVYDRVFEYYLRSDQRRPQETAASHFDADS